MYYYILFFFLFSFTVFPRTQYSYILSHNVRRAGIRLDSVQIKKKLVRSAATLNRTSCALHRPVGTGAGGDMALCNQGGGQIVPIILLFPPSGFSGLPSALVHLQSDIPHACKQANQQQKFCCVLPP